MNQSLIIKHVLPFLLWYALMIIFTITLDWILHYFDLVYIGLYLGYLGTLLIMISFVYSFRKRRVITVGSPKKLLMLHEYLAWAGSVLILVHAGIHYHALLPWLAVLMLLINVASGLVGKFLLKRSGATLSANKQAFVASGMSQEDADKKLFFDAVAVDVMKHWRSIHLPISIMFGILSLLHIITIFMFGK